ncbi:MAG: hypothetical protein QNK51_03635 [Chitinophagales bacterium]
MSKIIAVIFFLNACSFFFACTRKNIGSINLSLNMFLIQWRSINQRFEWEDVNP